MKQYRTRNTSQQVAIGRYLKKEMANHPLSISIQRLADSEDWRATIDYRNRWVHDKPPTIRGLGIIYQRRIRWTREGKQKKLFIGGGDEPEFIIQDVLNFIRTAFSLFYETLSEVADFYFRVLEASTLTLGQLCRKVLIMNSNIPPPPGWEDDDLAKFMDTARNNAYATFANLRLEYGRLSGIDAVFRKLIDNLHHTGQWFVGFFVLRAHSTFLGAAALAISGQIPEAYVLLRSCLENCLYGFHIYQNPSCGEVWLRRHDNEQAKRKVKTEFQIKNLLNTLKAISPFECEVMQALYERTIDMGAHPNERALMQNLKMDNQEKHIHFQMTYLDADSPALRLCLKTTAQTGVSMLGVFRLIFKERFDILGLSETLTRLRQGL